MTAAEKILSGIIDDAVALAEEIIENANSQADKIKSDAQQKAKAEAELIIAESEKKAKTQGINAICSAELLKRNEILSAKNEIIDNVISLIPQKIASFGDKDYFDFLYTLAEKNHSGEKGIMKLNQNDLSRDIKAFKDKISLLNIELNEKAEDIDGGFLLSYGDILINCSIEAIIREKKEELTDTVNSVLFR